MSTGPGRMSAGGLRAGAGGPMNGYGEVGK
jgi:hypothetical protein